LRKIGQRKIRGIETRYHSPYMRYILTQYNPAGIVDESFRRVHAFDVIAAANHAVKHTAFKRADTSPYIELIMVLKDGKPRALQHLVRRAHIASKSFVHTVQSPFEFDAIPVDFHFVPRDHLRDIRARSAA